MLKKYTPTIEDQWRAIILLGRNVASYKFALAKSLLELKPTEGQLVKLEELAIPFSTNISQHLKLVDRQCTSSTSKFLDICRQFNSQEIDFDSLIQQTVRLGFNNVIDAFHFVGNAYTPIRFFIDDRSQNQGIRITSEFSKLLETIQAANLTIEVESRWRLVETAWDMGISRSLLCIDYDAISDNLIAVNNKMQRCSVTGCHGALNGYQKGKCFYCFRDILLGSQDISPEIDHFFPHILKQWGFGPLIDGIWNLVLSCKQCNRGIDGKFTCVPSLKLLRRLFKRNEFLIKSHHPLRETIMLQTGSTQTDRQTFLKKWHEDAWKILIHTWEPIEVVEAIF